MAKRSGKRVIRCSECGSLLDKDARMNKIFSDADSRLFWYMSSFILYLMSIFYDRYGYTNAWI